MALVPIISTLAYNVLGTVGTITDTTVFGGANPARNTIAEYIEFWKMNGSSVATINVLTPNTSDAKTVSSWTFNSSVDGWYKARIYMIPEWVSGNYAAGSVIYYTTNQTIYKALILGVGNPIPTNATYFTPATLVDAAAAVNVTNSYQDYLVMEAGKTCAGDAAADWAAENDCGGCTKTNFAIPAYQKRLMVISAQRLASINLYSKAEEIARKLENLCVSC